MYVLYCLTIYCTFHSIRINIHSFINAPAGQRFDLSLLQAGLGGDMDHTEWMIRTLKNELPC